MNWLIYGANGYSGKLMAREARRRGLKPILAGRSAAAVETLAAELKLEARIFDLGQSSEVIREIKDCELVLHCAGPFSVTSGPMLDACLEAGVHYLDITGEISVFRHACEQSDRARDAGVVLIPGVGFDVVPSDCQAACLVRAMPAATQLELAFEAGGGPSPGTAKTSIEALRDGGCVRRDGELLDVPLAWKTRSIPFAHENRMAVSIPWGDVYTAYVSTGIPNITVYMSMSPANIANLRRLKWIRPILGLGGVQTFMKRWADKRVRGPIDRVREASGSELWGEVTDADGRTVSAVMSTPNGYDLTVSAGLGIVQYLLENDLEGGYYTPSMLMGADYAASLAGVKQEIL
jgi:short subunit dehydrogenase-like uncharacterized protein